ncbi:MAG: proton-conducting transporter membrane subunit [Desulfuromonadales bacterium]|jgi:multicomponent Na+:H+ antiporter subunit D|nr:proton-conducting transporter membrane subunit [Desulfuromonadales bacterium]
MSASNLPLFVLVAPLITALAVNLLGRTRRQWIAPLVLGCLSCSLFGAIIVMAGVLERGTLRYTVGNWRPPFGIELVIDPLSALMMVLITVVALLASFSSLKSVEQELPGREPLFFTLYLILISGLLGLVLTGDAFNLYVMLEITSITTYGLIAMGRGRAALASFNYIIMGSIGACFYLLGVGYLYILTGTLNMADIARIMPTLNAPAATATAIAFVLVGLWIKMAFFPLHSWLPNAYCHAPTGVGTMAAPLMTKVTVYLMVRVILSMYTPALVFANEAITSSVVWLASLAIICGSVLALGQKDLRRMLTYIIVAEVGYMVGGVFLANANGLTGSILHIVNDALMTLCLFLAVAAIIYRQGSVSLVSLQGIFHRMPITMAAFVLGAFAMIGVPPTCGFFSKWYLILGGIDAGRWEFVVALVVSSLINAVLFFRVIELAYFGSLSDTEHPASERHEAPWWMLKPLVMTAILLIVVGLSTGPLVNNVIRLMIPAGF